MNDEPRRARAVDDPQRVATGRGLLPDPEETARALRAAEDVARLLARLQRVTAAFAAALTPESVYAVVVSEAMAAADAMAGSFFLLEHGTHLRAVRAVGYPDDVVELFRAFPVDADLPAATAVRTGEPVFIGDVAEAGGLVRDIHVEGGRRAVAALPLAIAGTPVGALVLSFRDEQPFGTTQREFLDALANQCAVALERTRLYEAEQAGRHAAEAAQHRLGFLAEATRALASSLDRREVLRRLTRLSVSQLCDIVAVWLPRHGTLERTFAAHADTGLEAEMVRHTRAVTIPLAAENPIARCYATGQEQRVQVDEGLLRQIGMSPEMVADPRFQVHSSLVVPITARGRVLGVMVFSLVDPDRDFADADVAVALELGARAGVSMENAELFEREHSMAEILQHAILPQQLPEVPGFELAARYLPATSGVEVGGDWYDAFPLRDGRFGIVVGDVAGHGLRAAATMGQLRNGLRAYAVDGERPSVVVHRLDALLGDTEPDTLATLIYGVLDPATGVFQWCCAGHPPPIAGGPAGAAPLEAPLCTVLGVGRGTGFADAETVIAPGSALILYTDGLVERRGEHLGDGLERLRRAVEHAGDDGVHAVTRQVVRDLLPDGHRSDDVCLLALWRPPAT